MTTVFVTRGKWPPATAAARDRAERAVHSNVAQAEMQTPRILTCPSDTDRDPVWTFGGTNHDSLWWNGNYGVSYFAG